MDKIRPRSIPVSCIASTSQSQYCKYDKMQSATFNSQSRHYSTNLTEPAGWSRQNRRLRKSCTKVKSRGVPFFFMAHSFERPKHDYMEKKLSVVDPWTFYGYQEKYLQMHCSDIFTLPDPSNTMTYYRGTPPQLKKLLHTLKKHFSMNLD